MVFVLLMAFIAVFQLLGVDHSSEIGSSQRIFLFPLGAGSFKEPSARRIDILLTISHVQGVDVGRWV